MTRNSFSLNSARELHQNKKDAQLSLGRSVWSRLLRVAEFSESLCEFVLVLTGDGGGHTNSGGLTPRQLQVQFQSAYIFHVLVLIDITIDVHIYITANSVTWVRSTQIAKKYSTQISFPVNHHIPLKIFTGLSNMNVLKEITKEKFIYIMFSWTLKMSVSIKIWNLLNQSYCHNTACVHHS